ncbi:hypothetical protein GCM10010123_29650 [Pilimelia anulata]|uniref:Tachylectin n=1 Tax=Pilimelia anulata TaxID=53371 RepID=A0A8J3B9J0_9ACTN|nr:hypothetical protein GCM10010123_29650 [Pilimelia anulata]
MVTLTAPLLFTTPAVAGGAAGWKCGKTAWVFASVKDKDSTSLHLYQISGPGTATPKVAKKTEFGKGWDQYGRILGGPNGRIYAIHPTEGLFRYRWLGDKWEEPSRKLISKSFTRYAGSANRNKITVDHRGDIYLIDGEGVLRAYRWNEAANDWDFAQRPLATGWSKYDMVTAVGPGVLMTRTPAGVLFRHHYDLTTQRWLARDVQVGNGGWQRFDRGVTSAGGETLFALNDDHQLLHYRYERSNNSWPVQAARVVDKWDEVRDIAATSTTCTADLPAPADVEVPLRSFSRVAALRAGGASGPLDVALTDNAGVLRHGRLSGGGTVQWTPISGDQAFAGEPVLTASPKGVVSAYGHNQNGNVHVIAQAAEGSPAFKPPVNLGGEFEDAASVVTLTDGRVIVFAVDPDGGLWSRTQDPAADDGLLPWVRVTAPPLAEAPWAAALSDNGFELVGLDASGELRGVRYGKGAYGEWQSLGQGTVGEPAAIITAGPRARVFARLPDGRLGSQTQNLNGTYPQKWSPVGDLVVTGVPAAIQGTTQDSRVRVVARTEDGAMHQIAETANGSDTWGSWVRMTPAGEVAQSDPTIATLSVDGLSTWGVLFRSPDDALQLWYQKNPRRAGSAGFARVRVPIPTGR